MENASEYYVYITILSTEKKINCSPNDIACIEKCSQSGNCSCPPGSVMSPGGETCVGECFNPFYCTLRAISCHFYGQSLIKASGRHLCLRWTMETVLFIAFKELRSARKSVVNPFICAHVFCRELDHSLTTWYRKRKTWYGEETRSLTLLQLM